jgi:hypothetical protein
MDFRFLHQRTTDCISMLDVIELYNCGDEGYSPGEYSVADVDPITGEVTILGVGAVSGCVAVIQLGEAE